jgi:hypothetical protein
MFSKNVSLMERIQELEKISGENDPCNYIQINKM